MVATGPSCFFSFLFLLLTSSIASVHTQKLTTRNLVSSDRYDTLSSGHVQTRMPDEFSDINIPMPKPIKSSETTKPLGSGKTVAPNSALNALPRRRSTSDEAFPPEKRTLREANKDFRDRRSNTFVSLVPTGLPTYTPSISTQAGLYFSSFGRKLDYICDCDGNSTDEYEYDANSPDSKDMLLVMIISGIFGLFVLIIFPCAMVCVYKIGRRHGRRDVMSGSVTDVHGEHGGYRAAVVCFPFCWIREYFHRNELDPLQQGIRPIYHLTEVYGQTSGPMHLTLNGSEGDLNRTGTNPSQHNIRSGRNRFQTISRKSLLDSSIGKMSVKTEESWDPVKAFQLNPLTTFGTKDASNMALSQAGPAPAPRSSAGVNSSPIRTREATPGSPGANSSHGAIKWLDFNRNSNSHRINRKNQSSGILVLNPITEKEELVRRGNSMAKKKLSQINVLKRLNSDTNRTDAVNTFPSPEPETPPHSVGGSKNTTVGKLRQSSQQDSMNTLDFINQDHV